MTIYWTADSSVVTADSNIYTADGAIPGVDPASPVWNNAVLLCLSPGQAVNLALATARYAVSPVGASLTSWIVTSGALPAGLTLNSSTGVITGSSSPLTDSAFIITVTDSSSRATASPQCNILVTSTPEFTGTQAAQDSSTYGSLLTPAAPNPVAAISPRVRGRSISFGAMCELAGRPAIDYYPVYTFGGGQVRKVFVTPV